MSRGTRRLLVQLSLLAIIAVATGVLTFEAWSALRAHRAATVQAGRALANVVTRDVHALTDNMLDHQVATAFLLASRLPSRATPEVAASLQRIMTSPTRAPCEGPCMPPLAERAWVLDLRSGRLVLPPGETIDSAVARWVRDTVVTDIATEYKWDWQASYLRMPATLLPGHAIIHRVIYDAAGKPALSMVALMNYRAYGAVVVDTAVHRIVATRFTTPSAGTRGVAISVRDARGTSWVSMSSLAHPALQTTTWVSDAYVGAFRVDLAVSDGMLDSLVGLPHVHLSELLIIFALTLALIIVTGIQWAHERRAIELRERFVGDLSHELRTPLQQVRLFAELLALGKLRTAEKREEAMRIITAQTERTMQLLANLLAMARADRGQLRPNVTTVSMERALAPALAGLVPMVTQAGMQLDVGPLTDAPVSVDPNALAQILNNLVENALRHARCGDMVRVSALASDATVSLVVEDRGMGIRPADRARIWRRFVRLDRAPGSVEAPAPGTGIGLAVVAELVRMHRGRVWVEDATPHGARFVVELPCAARGTIMDDDRDASSARMTM